MMPRFSSSIWCARWSASRLAISGDRTGLVTTRYISLPRKFLVAGSTLLGTSAISFLPLDCFPEAVTHVESGLGHAIHSGDDGQRQRSSERAPDRLWRR